MLQIFTAGKRTDANGITVDFDESMLAQIAAIYDPALHEAPFVLGHPRHDAPAYGWAASLSKSGDRLLAEPRQVDPVFSESVQSGRYKKISASFYLPGSPHHPIADSEVPYLRHVGFLGAMPPAVKGMAAIEFAEDEEGVFFAEFGDYVDMEMADTLAATFQDMRDWLIESSGLENADRVLPSWRIETLRRIAQRPMRQAEPQSLSPIYSEEPMATELEAREASVAERERKLLVAEAANFCDGLISGGRGGVAGVRDKAVALLAQLSAESIVEFGEGESANPADVVKEILSAFPKDVVFTEVAPASGDMKVKDLDTVALASKAKALVAKRKAEGETLDYADAVREVAEQAGVTG